MHDPRPGKHFSTAVAIPAFLITLPAVLFYGILFRHLVNLPFLDDYDILQFLNQLVLAKGTAAKFLLLLAAQANEYKLFFVNGLSWLQLALLGHVNFAQLCVLGNSAVLVLAAILWSMFLPDQRDLGKRLAFFVPVAWLLFQMEYWESLDWAIDSLQNLWVIVFSLGAIHCLLQPSRRAYAGALICCVLAVAAFGNGLVVLPVGLLILATRRQFARAGGFLAVSAVCIGAYAYHYDFMSSQVQTGGSVFSEFKHWNPAFLIAVVGNAGALVSELAIAALWHLLPGFAVRTVGDGTFLSESGIDVGTSLALGTSLLVLFCWLVRRGYARRNPRVFSSMLFLLLTAAGVAGLRSGFGLGQILSPRYAIYGVLLLILAWAAVAEEFLQHRSETLLRNRAYLAMTAASIVLSLFMDLTGTKYLAQRESQEVWGMYTFEHPATPRATEGPLLYHPDENPSETELNIQFRVLLTESMRLGVYEPPRY